MGRDMIEIINSDSSVESVDLVTYLLSEDGLNQYVVYSKGETQGTEQDHVIYISKVVKEEESLRLEEIVADSEWAEVQVLLKKIANS